MSSKKPAEFTFEFGSTLTILTTAAVGVHGGRKVSSRGLFTGIVLDKSKLKSWRDLNRILVTVDAKYVMDEADQSECQYENNVNEQWAQPSQETLQKPEEPLPAQPKKPDLEKPKAGAPCKHKIKKLHKLAFAAWDQTDQVLPGKKTSFPWETEGEFAKKHQKQCEEFVVLLLLRRSKPFCPGQIVWIRVREIVAWAVGDCG